MNKTENNCTIEQFKEILDTHNLESTIAEGMDYEGKPYRCISFQFPVARNTETIAVHEDDDLYAIANCNFIKYRGISNYEAIWSKELSLIECEIQDARFGRPSRLVLRSLASIFGASQETADKHGRTEPTEIIIFSNDSLKVTVGFCSKELAFLSAYKEGRHIDISQQNGRFGISI